MGTLADNTSKYRKTKKGIVTRIYSTQIEKSKRRGHRPPEYTKKELTEWLYSQPRFHELYSEWVNSGYLTELKPSVDRREHKIHYCMTNIQLMTWRENNLKGIEESRRKEVRVFNRSGTLDKYYPSITAAGKALGIPKGALSDRLNQGGFASKGAAVDIAVEAV